MLPGPIELALILCKLYKSLGIDLIGIDCGIDLLDSKPEVVRVNRFTHLLGGPLKFGDSEARGGPSEPIYPSIRKPPKSRKSIDPHRQAGRI